MKNLGLFLILCVLVGGTYYYEEVYQKNEQQITKAQTQIFKSLDQVTSFKMKNFSLEKKDKWMVKEINYPASSKLIKDYLYILSEISSLGELASANEADYFKTTSLDFSIVQSGSLQKYSLGDISPVSGNFYLKVHGSPSKIYLCEDRSKFSGAYKDKGDLGIKKYLRLKSILEGDRFLFMERQLFKDLEVDLIQSIEIKNRHNRPYVLDLKKNKTTPETFPKVKYKNIKEVVSYLMTNSLAIGIIEPGQNILTNKISTLKFTLSEGTEIDLSVYAGLNGQYGKYAKFKNQQTLFRLPDDEPMIFKLFVQDYWNKKFLIQPRIKGIKSFEFYLSKKDQKFYPFVVDDVEKFNFRSLDSTVTSLNKNLLNFLFNLMFNLVDFKEADYIELLAQKSESELYLKIFEHKFGVSLEASRIRVIDYTSSLSYYFKYDTQAIKTTSLERIFTVKKK